MNRQQRRQLHQHISDVRIRVVDRIDAIADEINDPLQAGDRVRLDVKRIKGRKEYTGLQDEYKKFVEESTDRVFTVSLYRKKDGVYSAIVSLDGVDQWLFWSGDLIRIQEGD